MNLIGNKQPPTYLHFFDRELRRAENASYEDMTVLSAVIVSIFNSLSYCYCSASLIYENNHEFPVSTKLLIELEKLDLVKLIANEHSFSEFISSRQKIYAHKPDRYPMYFGNGNAENIWPSSPLIIADSTTAKLRAGIFEFVENPGSIRQLDKFKRRNLNRIKKKLYNEGEKAITLDLLLNKRQLVIDQDRRDSGRLISYFYTKRYLDLYTGDIICNLPQLSFYDILSNNPQRNNYKLLYSVLNCINVPGCFFYDKQFKLEYFISFVGNKMFKYFQAELLSIIEGLVALAPSSDIYRILAAFKSNVKESASVFIPDIDSFIASLYSNLSSLALKLAHNNEVFKHSYNLSKNELLATKKILIVTATPLETIEFLAAMESRKKTAKHFEIEKHVYWNFGVMNNSELIFLKTGMGSSGVLGSTLSINEAIKVLNPDYIIMIGVAFGLKKGSQSIGQILVSKELENYDYAKIMSSGTIQRGARIPAGVTLFTRFENSGFSLNTGVKVEPGFMISGNKLFDSEEAINKLKTIFPESIGGEMEGVGLQDTCQREGKEWILIKGICDWGYNKQSEDKENNQKVAIGNVCDYLLHTLAEYEF